MAVLSLCGGQEAALNFKDGVPAEFIASRAQHHGRCHRLTLSAPTCNIPHASLWPPGHVRSAIAMTKELQSC